MEIQYLEREFNPESVITVFDELFILEPRIAIFKVFAQKHKELITNTELDQ